MRRFFVLVACVLFLVLISSCDGFGRLNARVMSVFRVDGETVSLSNRAGLTSDAREGRRIQAGYNVSTGHDSFCYILLDTDSLVKLDVSTEIFVEQLNENRLRMVVDSGQVLVNVQNQSPEHTLETRIGSTVISVRGTIFVAGVHDHAEAVITVFEGTVYVNDVALEEGYTMRVYDGELMIYEITPIFFDELDDFQLAAWRLITDFEVINLRVGNVIQFGNYDWRVLDIQENQALIITDRVIYQRAYHNSPVAITWEKSDMRQWLNGEFFANFDPADQVRIVETYVINHDSPWRWRAGTHTPGGNNTTDRIFLLSIDEVLRYFGDSGTVARGAVQSFDERMAYTRAGVNQGFGLWYVNDDDNSARIALDLENLASSWWLRSPGYDTHAAANIDSRGRLWLRGWWRQIDLESYMGIRPALWLNLD